MHSTAALPPPSPTQTLHLIHHLLISCLTVKSFIGRWQLLRSKLTLLKTSLAEISASPHWSGNPLLHDLLLNLTKSISDQCQDNHPSSYAGEKLLMQSDLDMASAPLSAILHDFDLLLKSGLLRHSNVIVLSQPGPGSAKDELGFFIPDLFARLQIGGIEFKNKALESLLHLLAQDNKAAVLVSKEGDVGYLVRMLDSNFREQAAIVVSVLASSNNAWAISAYCGVPVTQIHADGAMKNIAAVEDVRMALWKEGAVTVLVQLLVSGTDVAQEKAAIVFKSLPHPARISGLRYYKKRDCRNFCNCLRNHRLADLIMHRNVTLQQISASLLVNLSISNANKGAIGGCMGALVKMVESPKPVGLQEMLDPKNELACKKYLVSVISAIAAGGSYGCRKKILVAGAYPHLQKLAEMEVDRAKKALQRLSGNRLKNILNKTRRE
ncbi:hypothetical protein HHK36_002156 [Tetracentron sinense]|uniref:DUF7032 domain-containing protein n=1 Tax=Tetracentron sinense TaxID=13715 RepID=A0A835A505_TETSI|nr:hypothetical protein HHK36_002156 [Tetracentron sinense]